MQRDVLANQMPMMTRAKGQRGLSLIESLIALMVLTLGVMGLAGVQARMLAENRTSNSRAIAVSLIDDITNRLIVNRSQALAGSYTLPLANTQLAAPVNCAVATCNTAQMVAYDQSVWRAALLNLMGPNAQSAIFNSVTDTRQIGVLIAWPSNEGKSRAGGVDPIDAAYLAPFAVPTGVATICPPVGFICHLVYLQP